jgi:hypothetical protein
VLLVYISRVLYLQQLLFQGQDGVPLLGGGVVKCLLLLFQRLLQLYDRIGQPLLSGLQLLEADLRGGFIGVSIEI